MKKKVGIGLVLATIIFWLGIYFFALPKPLFKATYSTVLYAEQGELLGARITSDEQWRFPRSLTVDERFELCILQKEDQYFQYHFGINPAALFRALYLNLSEGKVVSGASTISMQVIRLSRGNPPRTIKEKLWEMTLAIALELRYSKEEILSFYCTHAPFGGNVIGYETAAWRYFGRSPDQLSWSELASLAVLPNAPGMIHPGRNRTAFTDKRNQLLQRMHSAGIIDDMDYQLALLEEVPQSPQALPNQAPHLIAMLDQSLSGTRVISHIQESKQVRFSQILNKHLRRLSENKIHNGGILVIKNNTGAVEAYVGNASYPGAVSAFNDMLRTPRSSGSILKPFLYSAMLQSGELMPDQMVADIPTQFGSFAPENFKKSFDGAVAASDALTRSLNVPAVRLLRSYSIPKFLHQLNDLELSSINRNADHYGLSLILGGAEVTAVELGMAYSALAQKLLSYSTSGIKTKLSVKFDSLIYDKPPQVPFDEAAIYQTFQALTSVARPDSENGWEKFGRPNVAWKTGTSYGHRDAWAVGVTPNYTCVVWIGNASGEGRPGLVGAVAAGPVLFEVMNTLPKEDWFDAPLNLMKEVKVCRVTGFKATKNCDKHQLQWIPATSITKPCPYHQRIYVDANEKRVLRQCSDSTFIAQSYLVLPPSEAWYYSRSNPEYRPLPDWSSRCKPEESLAMEVTYPLRGSEIYIPTELGGEREKLIMEVVHRDAAPTLFWHLNGNYIGQTETFHQLAVDLARGDYRLHVEDNFGNEANSSFKIVSNSQ